MSHLSRVNDVHKYQPISSSEHQAQERHHSIEDPAALDLDRHLESFKQSRRKRTAIILMGAVALFLFLYWAIEYVLTCSQSRQWGLIALEDLFYCPILIE